MIQRVADQLRIERTTNPADALVLRNWFVPVDQSRLEVVVEVLIRMADDGDNTLVLCASRNDVLMGVSVSYMEESGRAFLWQARSKGLSRDEVDIGFQIICDWIRKKGVHVVATVPNRNKKIWARRWGFQEIPNSDEMVKVI